MRRDEERARARRYRCAAVARVIIGAVQARMLMRYANIMPLFRYALPYAYYAATLPRRHSYDIFTAATISITTPIRHTPCRFDGAFLPLPLMHVAAFAVYAIFDADYAAAATRDAAAFRLRRYSYASMLLLPFMMPPAAAMPLPAQELLIRLRCSVCNGKRWQFTVITPLR